MTHVQPGRTTRLLTPMRIAIALAAVLSFAFVAAAMPNDAEAKKANKSAKQIKKLNKQVKKANKQIKQLESAVAEAVELANQAIEQGGKVGPAGPAGPAGADGQNGENGQDGADGTDGESVSVSAEPPGGNCPDAGYKLSSADGTDYVCNGANGADGSPWTAGGTLPSGSTQTGGWSFTADGSEFSNPMGFVPVAVSFNVPLASETPAANAHYVSSNPAPAECENDDHPGAASVGNPEASPGHFCVYQSALGSSGTTVTNLGIARLDLSDAGTSAGGALILFSGTPPVTGAIGGFGSWAVTAE